MLWLAGRCLVPVDQQKKVPARGGSRGVSSINTIKNSHNSKSHGDRSMTTGSNNINIAIAIESFSKENERRKIDDGNNKMKSRLGGFLVGPSTPRTSSSSSFHQCGEKFWVKRKRVITFCFNLANLFTEGRLFGKFWYLAGSYLYKFGKYYNCILLFIIHIHSLFIS